VDATIATRPLLSWQDVRAPAGSEIVWGSHGRNHLRLPELAAQQKWDEVHGSRTDFENAVGSAVRFFAYPYGASVLDSVAAVARAGYSAACGIEFGLNDPATPLLQLRRIEIRGNDSMFRFALALWTGRTWIVRPVR